MGAGGLIIGIATVEILARTGNKVKPTHDNETGRHTSLAGVRDMYRTRATQPICAGVRETKQFLPLPKKQPLYIQNTNVQSSGMHKSSMCKITNKMTHTITDSHKYAKKPVNHIPALLRIQPKGILPRNTKRYGKYHLQRTWL